MQQEKKYIGYGYHGGGRKPTDTEARNKTLAIAGTPTEIEAIKSKAKESGKTVSRFIIEEILDSETSSE